MNDNPASDLAGLRILVVEDEFMVAELLCMMLEDFGCNVAGPCASVAEALAAVGENELDGAVLDVNLDGESSAPVAAALNAAAVPFVVSTGYGALSILDDALNHTIRISKPFASAQLKAGLQAAFARNA
jgi:DNA-binding response OmpR family regulator